MKKISPKQYAISLYEITKDIEENKLPEIIKNFIKLLAKNNALKFSHRIIKEFIKYYNEKEGVLEIEILSAKKLEKDLEKKIIDKFKKLKKVKDIALKKKIDHSLIGGLVFKIEDLVIDGSLKRNLEKMKEKII